MHKSGFIAEKSRTNERVDVPFVILVLLLCGTGFITLYSGSLGFASRLFDDPLYFVKRQGVNLAVSLIAMLVASFFNLEYVRKWLPKIVIVTLVISLLPFVPGIGVSKNGAARWIGIGASTFQPSELIKLMLVFYLANIFAKKADRLDEPRVAIFPPAIFSLAFVGIIYLQNDFSTSVFVLLTVVSMFFAAGVDWRWFVRFALVLIPVMVFAVLTKEYRMERVISFLRPEHDPLGAGYQVNAAIEALSEGGFWGRGLGNGVRKISGIPEVQSDFIFAVWGEEMGFVGVCLYFTLLLLFTARGLWISLRCCDRFRCLLAFGSTIVIFFQSLMNCGVVVRAFPATGVPMPFYSSGGSSLLITLCLCGFIINVSRWMPDGESAYV